MRRRWRNQVYTSTSRSAMYSVSLRLSYQNVFVSDFVAHLSCLSDHLSCLSDHPDSIFRRANLIISAFAPSSCHVFSVRSKYRPQHFSLSENSMGIFLVSVEREADVHT